MSKSEVKRLATQLTLDEAQKKLEEVEGDLRELESRKHLMIDVVLALRAKECKLVIGETLVGDLGGRGRKGIFNGYYRKYFNSGKLGDEWIKVLLLKKDGKVGKREVTLYGNWEVVKQ